MTANISDYSGLHEWLVARLGSALEPGVKAGDEEAFPEPMLAFRIGEDSMVRVPGGLVEPVRKVADGLSNDELYSVLGAYELSRVTLEQGVSVWGPTFWYFGDERTVRSGDGRAEALSRDRVDAIVDPEVFWHCDWRTAAANFGIVEGDRLVALTTVRDIGAPVFEIGVDVAPDTGLRGLGGAVMKAAYRWILEQGGLVHARTSPWNVPSARLLRSVGLRNVLCELVGTRGGFKVPPQPLGKPRADTVVHDHYPVWAQNSEIVRR